MQLQIVNLRIGISIVNVIGSIQHKCIHSNNRHTHRQGARMREKERIQCYDYQLYTIKWNVSLFFKYIDRISYTNASILMQKHTNLKLGAAKGTNRKWENKQKKNTHTLQCIYACYSTTAAHSREEKKNCISIAANWN